MIFNFKKVTEVKGGASTLSLSYVNFNESPKEKTVLVNFDQKVWDQLIDFQDRIDDIDGDDYVEQYKQIISEVEALVLPLQNTKDSTQSVGQIFVKNTNTGRYYMIVNGVQTTVPVPEKFVKLYEEKFAENVKNAGSLVKFWVRFLRNETLKTRSAADKELFANNVVNYITATTLDKQEYENLITQGFNHAYATKNATVPEIKITREGLLQTYKVVAIDWSVMKYKYVLDEQGNVTAQLRDNYEKVVDENTGAVSINTKKDLDNEEYIFYPVVMGKTCTPFFCEDAFGTTIRVGKRVYHSTWDKVNCNLNSTCVAGHHIGSLSYIAGYESKENATLNCFVDPMYIGACVDNCNVIRVKEYFVASVKNRESHNKAFYNPSKYAAMTDTQWNTIRNEIIAKNNKDLLELQNAINKDNDLLSAL